MVGARILETTTATVTTIETMTATAVETATKCAITIKNAMTKGNNNRIRVVPTTIKMTTASTMMRPARSKPLTVKECLYRKK